ncbi:MAG: hypothetical protein H7315_18970, partial [Herminiimonas sp.]|nr:hypothetical protein [Herminiimonas sp.]
MVPLALCVALPSALAAPKDVPADAALELHKKGQYQNAATRGLSDLLLQPWNHELRFIVADSLQRIGKNTEASTQLEALEGTAYGETATTRLNALRMLERGPIAQAPVSGTAPTSAATAPATMQLTPTAPPFVIKPLSQGQNVTPTGASGGVPIQAGSGSADDTVQAKRSPAAQRIAQFNAKENYQSTGTEGLALLASEKPDEELQLIIANSLAWTG